MPMQSGVEIEIKDFEADVIRKSHEIPVVVDFWAEWCGPCHVLGPVLESLAARNAGRWTLAKVDTEAHQKIAAEYGVRGIPAVKLFVDGKVTEEFTGALPEQAIVQWLEKALPGRFRKEVARAGELLQVGRESEARALLEDILRKGPQEEAAKVLLARILVKTERETAAGLVDGIEEHSEHFPVADAVRTIASLLMKLQAAGSLPDGPARTVYLDGIRALADNDYGRALERFIEVIRKDRYYDDDGARRLCIALFRILGDADPVTMRYRREFSSALY